MNHPAKINHYPNFIFIGPDKSGSTWLFEIFRQHPNIYVPEVKELFFFDRYFSKGMDWYLSFFCDANINSIAVGELSHDYLFSQIAAKRIAEALPNVRLLSTLRNPIERTFSHYLYLVRSGATKKSFNDALHTYPELIEKSLYYKHLSAYYEIFDQSNIGIFWFDDLIDNPLLFAEKIFNFLEVPNYRNINYNKQVLPASKPRSFHIARLMKWGANLVRSLGFPKVVGKYKNHKLTQWLYKPYELDQKPKIIQGDRELLKNSFQEDILALQSLLNKDLTGWLES